MNQYSDEDTMNFDQLSQELREEEDKKPSSNQKPGISNQPHMKFVVFCNLLEKLAIMKPKAKLKLMEKFFQNYLINKDPYSVVRLLLPHLDRERGHYGLKELTLARLYADIMMLPKFESDRLKHYKNPTKQPAGAPAGDFVSVLLSVMDKRCRTDSILTLEDVNKYLDDLSKAVDTNEKKVILSKMFNDCTLMEQKWIVRIILKDLKIGMGHETVLKNYHPDAVELYNITSDLKEVFSDLKSKNKRLGTDKFRMFLPIRPMLAEKLPLKKLGEILEKTSVFIETKFDGERIQCHYKDEVVKFFSRNSHNYTHIYGPKLAAILRNNINAKSCILDGEIVVWDSIKNAYAPFGQNKTVALNEEEDNPGKQLCYKVFDILYVQGNHGEEANLMTTPLKDRKMVLGRVVKPVKNSLEVVKGTETQDVTVIYEEFNKSVANNEEGIMVKQIDSTYKPAERTQAWIKLKGEYIDNLGDSLDLLIIGGYFGEGRRTGAGDWTSHITVFLLGVRKGNTEDPKAATILPFCKVGTGYSFEELDHLRAKLKTEWRRYDPRIPHAYFWEWQPAASERPDAYIQNIGNSVVLEIRAAEVVESDQYPTGYTLRFPRVNRIRYDKNWNDTFSMEDLKNLLENFGEQRRLKRKHKNIEEIIDDQGQKKKRKKKELTQKKEAYTVVLDQFKDTDTTNVELKSIIFRGFEFYVANVGTGEEETHISKSALETYIVENGGNKVQNLLPSTTHIIAGKKDFKINNIIKETRKCVIHFSWILKCIAQSQLVDLTPRYMVYSNPQMEKYFKENLDEYNDHYTQAITVTQLKEIMEDMPAAEINFDVDVSTFIELKDKYMRKLTGEKNILFKDLNFYFHHHPNFSENDCKTNELILAIRHNGGSITNKLDLAKITHIVSHNFTSASEKKETISLARKHKIEIVLVKTIFDMIKQAKNVE